MTLPSIDERSIPESTSDVISLTPQFGPELEALLLVATEPLSIAELCELTQLSKAKIETLLTQLAVFYDETHRGFYLAALAGGFQIRTRSEMSMFVDSYVTNHYSTKLSKAALETLAVVAYKQPISRAQISAVRGVNSDGVVRMLISRGYVAQTQKDLGPGQAVLLTTSRLFLEKLGIFSLDELPALSDFVPVLEAVEALEAAILGE